MTGWRRQRTARPSSQSRGGTSRGFTIALLGAIALAWLLVVFAPDGMGMGPLAFVAAWTVMMAAMMLPSVAPLVLLYRLGATTRATTLLIAGYLVVWSAAGIPRISPTSSCPCLYRPSFSPSRAYTSSPPSSRRASCSVARRQTF